MVQFAMRQRRDESWRERARTDRISRSRNQSGRSGARRCRFRVPCHTRPPSPLLLFESRATVGRPAAAIATPRASATTKRQSGCGFFMISNFDELEAIEPSVSRRGTRRRGLRGWEMIVRKSRHAARSVAQVVGRSSPTAQPRRAGFYNRPREGAGQGTNPTLSLQLRQGSARIASTVAMIARAASGDLRWSLSLSRFRRIVVHFHGRKAVRFPAAAAAASQAERANCGVPRSDFPFAPRTLHRVSDVVHHRGTAAEAATDGERGAWSTTRFWCRKGRPALPWMNMAVVARLQPFVGLMFFVSRVKEENVLFTPTGLPGARRGGGSGSVLPQEGTAEIG